MLPLDPHAGSTLTDIGASRRRGHCSTLVGSPNLPSVHNCQSQNWSSRCEFLSFLNCPIETLTRHLNAKKKSILPYLQKSFSSVFSQGDIFSTLAADLHSTPIHWNIPSSSHTLITSALASPLFVALGPLSRAIGRCIEAMGKQSSSSATIASIKSASDGCQILSKKIHKDWAQSTWSDIENESELDEETRTHTEPWTVLKTLLFAITLIHSSILVVIAPKPGDKITALQKELAEQGLRTLATTYFITIKFGPDGFGAWRGVWSGLMEIAGSGGGKDVEQFLRTLEPKRFGSFTLHFLSP